jgi:tetratricopeptide (TPR) repeat protein
VAGIGADNFQQQYLAHGHSSETPRYPHSVELRTLTETGVLGAALALLGLGAALVGAAGGVLRSDPLGRAVAAAALAGFAYWLVHGSFDWFWEFAGLGAPAFALLGLACALAPRRGDRGAPRPSGALSGLRVAVPAAALVTALAMAGSLAAPWLSQLELQDAARIWTRSPRAAYSRLEEAAGLNPLSDEAYLLAGSIALRYGELARADREFSRALARAPGDAYATLERGAIASARGDRGAALALLQHALQLDPRDALAREALAVARAGDRVSIRELNRLILLKAEQLA